MTVRVLRRRRGGEAVQTAGEVAFSLSHWLKHRREVGLAPLLPGFCADWGFL